MATFQKRGAKWRAIVRKKGHPAQSKTFSTKARAQAWAKEVEGRIEDVEAGILSVMTLGEISNSSQHGDHSRFSGTDRARSSRRPSRVLAC